MKWLPINKAMQWLSAITAFPNLFIAFDISKVFYRHYCSSIGFYIIMKNSSGGHRVHFNP